MTAAADLARRICARDARRRGRPSTTTPGTLFSRDASMYAITPLGVVFPRHADDVAAAVAARRRSTGSRCVPRGGGTSLAGQTVGPGLVLDLSRHMHRIVELDAEARTARVQPGVVQDELNRAAARTG